MSEKQGQHWEAVTAAEGELKTAEETFSALEKQTLEDSFDPNSPAGLKVKNDYDAALVAKTRAADKVGSLRGRAEQTDKFNAAADKHEKLMFDNNKSWPQSGDERNRFITERVHDVVGKVRAAKWPEGVPPDEMGDFRAEVEKGVNESLKAKPWKTESNLGTGEHKGEDDLQPDEIGGVPEAGGEGNAKDEQAARALIITTEDYLDNNATHGRPDGKADVPLTQNPYKEAEAMTRLALREYGTTGEKAFEPKKNVRDGGLMSGD